MDYIADGPPMQEADCPFCERRVLVYEDPPRCPLCACPLEERRKIIGIGPKRAEIIIAGAAVLSRFLQDLQLPSLYYCSAGLRDGTALAEAPLDVLLTQGFDLVEGIERRARFGRASRQLFVLEAAEPLSVPALDREIS